jgi:hypothetical protein
LAGVGTSAVATSAELSSAADASVADQEVVIGVDLAHRTSLARRIRTTRAGRMTTIVRGSGATTTATRSTRGSAIASSRGR